LKFDRVLFGQREALAFFGQDMDQGRPFDLFDIFQSRNHRRDIMPVDGSDILKTQTFEEKSRGDQTKKRIANLSRRLFDMLAAGQTLEQSREILLQPYAEVSGELPA
jgi:hypothetical protein